MKITSINITKTQNNERQLVDVSIVIDYCLLIDNIKLIDNGKKMFVAFSSSKRKNSDSTFPDVVPLNPQVRNYIEGVVIAEYNKLYKEVIN